MRAHAHTLALCSLLALAALATAPLSGTTLAKPALGSGDAQSSPKGAASVVSGVPEIIDGDSIEVDGVSIRLHGIDAPEMMQSCKATPAASGFKTPPAETWKCGLEARRALAHIIGRGKVTCAPTTVDLYGRTVARCHTEFRQGGADIGAEMVRAGLAWAFVRYSTDYVEIEREARKARRGIWQADTQSAWDFRAAKWQQAQAESPATDGCAIKGNVTWKGERIYHLPWSPWYANVRMESGTAQHKGKRWFCSEAEAVAAGWRPSMR